MIPSLEDAQQCFAGWRSQKKTVREAIPEELWKIAVELTERYPQQTVAKELGLNVANLSRRRREQPTKISQPIERSGPFVELDLSASPSSGHCHRIEIERTDGHRLSVYAPPETPFDLQEVIHLFLGGKNVAN